MSRDILVNVIDADSTQPRKHFDEGKLRELADSMAENGLIVPILLRPAGDRYVIVHGERRYRAAILLGWSSIQAETRDIDTEAARWLALIENIQRDDLSPIEEAEAYRRMLDDGITQAELGKRIGKTQSHIAGKLRLLELPEMLKCYLDAKLLSEGHIKQLLRLRNIYTSDVTRTFDSTDADFIIDEQTTVFAVSLVLRPFAAAHGAIFAEKHLSAHLSAIRLFQTFLTRNNYVVPSWTVAAFWFAMVSVQEVMAVSSLQSFVDTWRDLFYSAIVGIGNNQTERQQYADDLRHAGVSTITDKLRLSAGKHILEIGYTLAPSQVVFTVTNESTHPNDARLADGSDIQASGKSVPASNSRSLAGQ